MSVLPLHIDLLQQKIGYRFCDQDLLRCALTHSSFANEHRVKNNERLEFLGDSVISMVVGYYLYNTYRDLPEGRLTVMRKNAVCQHALANYATAIDLGSYLLLGKGEEKDRRTKPKILEDAFEALLGAVYLDSGSIERVAEFLLPFVKKELQGLAVEEDYKTLLQQRVQQTPGEVLRYETVDEQGPDNSKTYTVQVFINSNAFGTGKGSSKKEAEQNAAREAFQKYLP